MKKKGALWESGAVNINSDEGVETERMNEKERESGGKKKKSEKSRIKNILG